MRHLFAVVRAPFGIVAEQLQEVIDVQPEAGSNWREYVSTSVACNHHREDWWTWDEEETAAFQLIPNR